MRNHSLICTAVFLTSLSLGACGDDGGGGGGPSSAKDFFAQAEESFCSFEVSCGGFPDVATCKSVTFDDGTQATLEAEVEAGTLDYNSDKADACLDAFGALTCDAIFSAGVDDLQQKCGAVFTGHVAVGGACVDSEECADENTCTKPDTCSGDDACCAGVCEETPKGSVALGGDCTVNQRCVVGAYCKADQAGGTASCAAQVEGEGTACDSFLACKAPLVCNIDFATGAGTCYTPAAHDQTCDPNVFFGACALATDYCDTATTKCTAKGKDGDPCDAQQTESCVAYAFCDAGTCKNRPVEGGTCASTGAECLGDLDCNASSVCAAPPAATACP